MPDFGVSRFASLEPPGARLTPQHHTQQADPWQAYEHPGLNGYMMPTASRRKLNIRKFDGTELDKGLGSGFSTGYALSCAP